MFVHPTPPSAYGSKYCHQLCYDRVRDDSKLADYPSKCERSGSMILKGGRMKRDDERKWIHESCIPTPKKANADILASWAAAARNPTLRLRLPHHHLLLLLRGLITM